MDWIAQCIDRIIQSQIWRFISTHFYWVDWATIFFTVWGFIHGLRRGLLRTLVQTAEIGLIAYGTFLYHDKLSLQLHTYLPFLSKKVLPVAGYLAVGLPVAILIFYLDSKLSKVFQTTLAKPLRAIGGAAAGVFYGLFIWSFLSQPLIATPVRSIQKAYESGISISGPFIKNFAPNLYRKVQR